MLGDSKRRKRESSSSRNLRFCGWSLGEMVASGLESLSGSTSRPPPGQSRSPVPLPF